MSTDLWLLEKAFFFQRPFLALPILSYFYSVSFHVPLFINTSLFANHFCMQKFAN